MTCSKLRVSVWANVGEVGKQRASRPGGQEQSLCGNAGFGKLGWGLWLGIMTCELWGGSEGCQAHFRLCWPISCWAVMDGGDFSFIHICAHF